MIVAHTLGIEGGNVLAHERQIEGGVQATQDVLRGDERLGADTLDLIRIPGLLADHGTSLGQQRSMAFPLDWTSPRRFRVPAPWDPTGIVTGAPPNERGPAGRVAPFARRITCPFSSRF